MHNSIIIIALNQRVIGGSPHMIFDEIIELYEIEIDYLNEYYSSTSLSSYLCDLKWINEELERVKKKDSLHKKTQIQTLEELKKSVSKRIKTCLKSQTNNVILDLHICITELKAFQKQSSDVSVSSLPFQMN